MQRSIISEIRPITTFGNQPTNLRTDSIRMSKESLSKQQIDRFIRDEIDSVPQLEALLLFWNHPSTQWTCEDLAKELYVSPLVAENVLTHLAGKRLILEVPESSGRYALHLESQERETLLSSLDTIYRQELVRISKMIHAKDSPGLRDFARSFRFKRD